VNNITTIDSHVVLPHQADWSEQPRVTRIWRSNVAQAQNGAEDRVSVRGNAWLQLSYAVKPFNHVERARFDDRMRAGMKAGGLAVPHWGKGMQLASAVSAAATTITLDRVAHNITVGKHILIQRSVPATFDTWDVRLVTNVSSATLTLSSGLTNGYPAGTFVWPVLFGKPITEGFTALNTARGRYPVKVQFDQRQINAFAHDDFEDYELGPITADLEGGNGWAGPWVFGIAA
jgi:hypothetical protein